MEEDYDPSEQGIVKVITDIEMHDEIDYEEGDIDFSGLSPEEIQQLFIERPDIHEQLMRQGYISVGDDEEEFEGEGEDYDDEEDEEDEEEYSYGEEEMFERMREEEGDMREKEGSEVN